MVPLTIYFYEVFMAKYTYVEQFISIEGEGPESGTPTVYIRFTNCNFTCSKFNNPNNIDPSSIEALKFDPKRIATVQEIPEITIGCDSIYAWHPSFKHMWTTVDERELATQLTDLLPVNRNRDWSKDILSLTGGEPTLRAKTIPTLLNQPEFDSLNKVLIETNCSVKLKDNFIQELKEWTDKKKGRKIIWSNSPKLSASGEDYSKAIIPEIAITQRKFFEDHQYQQYFKFVCDAKEEHFVEVGQAMEDYYKVGIPRDVGVYIMPMACTSEQQQEIMTKVADMCIERGYIYCHRIHNTVYSNAIGK